MNRGRKLLLGAAGLVAIILSVGTAHLVVDQWTSRKKEPISTLKPGAFDEAIAEVALLSTLREQFGLSDKDANDVLTSARNEQRSIVKRATDRAYTENKDYEWGIRQVLTEMHTHELRLRKASPPGFFDYRRKARHFLLFKEWAPAGISALLVE